MRFVKIAHISQESVLKIEFFEDFVSLKQSCSSTCLKKILFITAFSWEIWWYFHKSWRNSTPKRTCSPDYVDFWKLMHTVCIKRYFEICFLLYEYTWLSRIHLVQNNLVLQWFFIREKWGSNFISDKPIF